MAHRVLAKSFVSTLAPAALVLLGLGALASCSDGEAPAAPPAAEAPDAGPTFATSMVVDYVAINQAVNIPLLDDAGAPRTSWNAPVIAGRPGLVRVHVKNRTPRDRTKASATLRVQAPGRPDVTFPSALRTPMPFEEADLETTFNFDLPAEAIAPGAGVVVEVTGPAGSDGVVRFPAEGAISLNVAPSSPTLRVTFVPIRYDADGSGRLPNVSEAAIENYRRALFRWYPTASVELSVRQPLAWPMKVQPDGKGWDDLLDAVIETRSDDEAADDVYYVAVFDPAESAHAWCANQGCVLGIAPQAKLRDVYLRVAMITGYPDNESTLAQELGHAMGRGHAPCGGAAAIDYDYPYGSAGIGVFGWNIVDRELVSPNERLYDFMSYCHPNWVSDYTYAGLHERMVRAAETGPLGLPKDAGAPDASAARAASVGLRVSRVLPDGSVRPGPRVRVRTDADGAELTGLRAIAGLPGALRVDLAQ